jgi:hypothetical protein
MGGTWGGGTLPIGAAAPILAPIAGAAAGSLFGGGGASNAQPVLPKDLQPLRQQNIGLLQYLLGFNQPGQPWSQPQGGQAPAAGASGSNPYTMTGPPGSNANPWGFFSSQPSYPRPTAAQGGAIQRGQTAGSQPNMFPGGTQGGASLPNMGGTSPFSGMANLQTGGGTPATAGNDPLGRIESYFGQLGTPTTALQQQSLGGISQFLNSNPYGQANTALQGILGGSGFNEGNQAFRDAGAGNFFGGAQNAFQGAQGAFQGLGGQNLFGQANDVFSRLEGFNPFGSAQQSLEGVLAQNPGQGMLEALRPQFERNMAAANQTGGRFGSANAILRSRAVDDYNLLGAQALQRGTDQQINAANQLGMIGNSLIGARQAAGQGMLGVGNGMLNQGLGVGQGLLGAGQGMLGVGQGQLGQALGAAQGLSGNAQAMQQGQLGAAGQMSQNQNNMFNALQGGYQTGSAQASQEAQRQQQMLSILQNLLGASFGATLGVPSAVQPTGAQTGAQLGGSIGQILAMQGGGGTSGGMIPTNPATFGIPYNIGGSNPTPGIQYGGFGVPLGF